MSSTADNATPAAPAPAEEPQIVITLNQQRLLARITELAGENEVLRQVNQQFLDEIKRRQAEPEEEKQKELLKSDPN